MPARRLPSAFQRWQRVLGLLALTAALPGRAHACTKVPYLTEQAPDLAQLIGTARADTLLAGPGGVEYRSAPGHFGPAVERTIYG